MIWEASLSSAHTTILGQNLSRLRHKASAPPSTSWNSLIEHYRVVIRPSGTEAKLKYYFDYREAPNQNIDTADRYRTIEPVVWSACSRLYSDLAIRVGYQLSDGALELPDVMPVPEKAASDRPLTP